MDEISHIQVKKSMWDGTVTALCGQKYKPGYYREPLFGWLDPITCPGCKAAQKARKTK